MTDRELFVVMRSPVIGINGDMLRNAIGRVFRNRRDMIPEDARAVVEAMDPEVLASIVDIAAIAAQCCIRRKHNLPEPLGAE